MAGVCCVCDVIADFPSNAAQRMNPHCLYVSDILPVLLLSVIIDMLLGHAGGVLPGLRFYYLKVWAGEYTCINLLYLFQNEIQIFIAHATLGLRPKKPPLLYTRHPEAVESGQVLALV